MAIAFDPETTTDKKEFKTLPEGKYFAHINEYKDPVTLTTKVGKECDILKLTMKVDGKSHPDYADSLVWCDVWITKSINGKDPDSSDNLKFFRFLEAINYPLDEEEAEINGEVKKVKMLPSGAAEIFQDHIVGKPIIITTFVDKYENKDGEIKTSAKVKYFDAWQGKEAIKMETVSEEEDLPF